jgi:hypothetical protein
VKTTSSIATALLCSALLSPAATVSAADERRQPPPAELTEKPFLFEIARHLYRWHLDERDLEDVLKRNEFIFWVRQLHPRLDPADHSLFGEILLPQLGVCIKLKKADYAIPELKTKVRSDTFKIIAVARAAVPKAAPQGAVEIRAAYETVRDYCFRTRNLARFPDEKLLSRMRVAVRHELQEEVIREIDQIPEGRNVVYIAPLSPVANEIWVYSEIGRALIRVASDIDLEEPALWEHEELAVDLYDIDEQVVVSLDEVAGSNAYMTRDHVGRVLFNCLVLGKRLELQPFEREDKDR